MEANITQLKLLKLHVDRKLLKPPKKKFKHTKLSTIKEEPHKKKQRNKDEAHKSDEDQFERDGNGDEEQNDEQKLGKMKGETDDSYDEAAPFKDKEEERQVDPSRNIEVKRQTSNLDEC